MATIAAAPLAETKQRIKPLTVTQVARALERGEAILMDLREPGERVQQGVIPGAVPATWGMLAFWDELTEAYHRTKRQTNGRVVVYCAAGVRSAVAADLLQRMSYTTVTYLKGGFIAWKAAGRSMEEVSTV
jgi:rhodanese-related sulfurtransferase